MRWCLPLLVGCAAPSERLPKADDFSVADDSPVSTDSGGSTVDSASDSAVDSAVDSAEDTADPLDADGDGVQVPDDCDDTNPDVHPDATEVCDNGLDDDCDGQTCRWDGTGAVVRTGRASDSAGAGVALGDVTGDGVVDVLVGAPDAAAGDRPGSVWLWPGPLPETDGLLEDGGTALGSDAVAAGAGRFVRVPGDLNGDGYAELVVGTHHFPDVAAGRFAVLMGPVDGPVSEPNAWLPVPEDLGLHLFVATGPTVGATATLLVGAPLEGGGVVRVLDGSRAGEWSLDDALVTWTAAGGAAGRSVAVPGDWDGDGVDDVVIGVPDASRVAVFRGPVTDAAVEDADHWLEPDDARATFGTEVMGAGDVDGDGLADVLAAVAVNEGDAGTVGLFCALAECARFDGQAAGDQLGHALTTLGDADRDGHADVVLAAHGSGSVGVWYGPLSGSHTLDTADASASVGGQAGFSMAAADGWVALGAPTAGTSDPPAGGVVLVGLPDF